MPSGAMDMQVVGEKFFLLNIIFCLASTFTPPGKPLRGDVSHPTVGHQDGRALVPCRCVRRAGDVHPHRQLRRAETALGYAVVGHIARTSYGHARRAVVLPGDGRG